MNKIPFISKDDLPFVKLITYSLDTVQSFPPPNFNKVQIKHCAICRIEIMKPGKRRKSVYHFLSNRGFWLSRNEFVDGKNGWNSEQEAQSAMMNLLTA